MNILSAAVMLCSNDDWEVLAYMSRTAGVVRSMESKKVVLSSSVGPM